MRETGYEKIPAMANVSSLRPKQLPRRHGCIWPNRRLAKLAKLIYQVTLIIVQFSPLPMPIRAM